MLKFYVEKGQNLVLFIVQTLVMMINKVATLHVTELYTLAIFGIVIRSANFEL